MYGKFSKAYFDDEFYGENRLLEFPNILLDNVQASFSAALWFYMTPHFPKPSAHDVITGLFKPNDRDREFGIGNDFGSTIAIMAQDSSDDTTEECYKTSEGETEEASSRIQIYESLLDSLGLSSELESSKSCAEKQFVYNGAGKVNSFWQAGRNKD